MINYYKCNKNIKVSLLYIYIKSNIIKITKGKFKVPLAHKGKEKVMKRKKLATSKVKPVICQWIATVLIVLMMIPGQAVGAAAKTLQMPGVGYKDGRYIYYADQMGGLRMGITRFDTKTNKTKIIYTGTKNNKESTIRHNGFYDITVKDNYIYFIWDKNYGSNDRLEYLYRMKKDGTKVKKLAEASSYVIKDNRIYYIEAKKVSDDDHSYTESTGRIRKIKLNGDLKKTVKKFPAAKMQQASLVLYNKKQVLYRRENAKGSGYLYYSMDGERVKVPSNVTFQGTKYMSDPGSTSAYNGNSKYYTVEKNGSIRSLKKKNLETGKKNTIISVKENAYIDAYTVCGKYLIVRITDVGASKGKLYIVKESGKGKKLLKTWSLGE